MNSYLKSFIILSLSIVFSVNISFGQYSASHVSAALEMLNMVNMEKTLAQSVDISLEAQIQANPNLKPYEDILRSFLAKYMSWSYLKDRLVALYIGEFTEKELRAIIEFYKTDIGKKAIEKLPVLFAKASEIGQQAVQDNLPELTEAIQKRMNELNKE